MLVAMLNAGHTPQQKSPDASPADGTVWAALDAVLAVLLEAVAVKVPKGEKSSASKESPQFGNDFRELLNSSGQKALAIALRHSLLGKLVTMMGKLNPLRLVRTTETRSRVVTARQRCHASGGPIHEGRTCSIVHKRSVCSVKPAPTYKEISMGYRNFDVAIVMIVLASFMFIGCASHPIPETTREVARTAPAPQVAAPVASCRPSGRTTMVRGGGDCPVAWDGRTVRVSGNVDVTPGTNERGVPCLRLQIKDTSPVTVKPYGTMSCGRPSRELVAKLLGEELPEAGPIDVALEDDGERLLIVRGRVEATRQGLIRSRDPTIKCDTSMQEKYGNREAVCR